MTVEPSSKIDEPIVSEEDKKWNLLGRPVVASDNYYTQNALIRLGFDKKNITVMSEGGCSMTDIFLKFDSILKQKKKPSHILIGLTNTLRVGHYKHWGGGSMKGKVKSEISRFQERNFEIIMRIHLLLPKVMFDMCQDNNLKCYFISNLYFSDDAFRQIFRGDKKDIVHDMDKFWKEHENDDKFESSPVVSFIDKFESPPEFPSFITFPINGVPEEYQWFENTPFHTHRKKSKYLISHGGSRESSNHLTLQGNKICGNILYEKLYERGWGET